MKAVRDAHYAIDFRNQSLCNSVYGLYDGYLYHNLAEELYEVLDFETFCNIHKTIRKIERLTDEA